MHDLGSAAVIPTRHRTVTPGSTGGLTTVSDRLSRLPDASRNEPNAHPARAKPYPLPVRPRPPRPDPVSQPPNQGSEPMDSTLGAHRKETIPIARFGIRPGRSHTHRTQPTRSAAIHGGLPPTTLALSQSQPRLVILSEVEGSRVLPSTPPGPEPSHPATIRAQARRDVLPSARGCIPGRCSRNEHSGSETLGFS
jgi:hypothetical protein